MTEPRIHTTGVAFLVWLLVWTAYLVFFADMYLDYLSRAVDGHRVSAQFRGYVLFPAAVLVANAALVFVARWLHRWVRIVALACEPVLLVGYASAI